MKIKIARAGLAPTHVNVEVFAKNKLGDRPVAFILPGGPGADHTNYLKYTCLQTVADLVFHDPRGCGESDKADPSTYTMANYIEDVESIRLALGLNQIIVIGKSYGAMCALGYAVRYPASVAKLVLSAGAPSYHFLEKAKQNVEERGTPEQKQVCEKLWTGSFADYEDLLAYFQATNTLYSVRARTFPQEFDLANKCRHFSCDVINEGFRNQLWHFDFSSAMPTLTCPTLILAGEQDWITDVQYSRQMAASIPHSKLMVFQQASHAMEADVPEEYFQRLDDFISR